MNRKAAESVGMLDVRVQSLETTFEGRRQETRTNSRTDRGPVAQPSRRKTERATCLNDPNDKVGVGILVSAISR